MHEVADTHDTDSRGLLLPELGLDINVHVLPSQIMASESYSIPFSNLPTATQEVCDKHDTDNNSLLTPLPALGLATRDQVLPFDTITKDSSTLLFTVRMKPTAVHEVAETQDTDHNLCSPPNSGVSAMVQEFPSQAWIVSLFPSTPRS
jgi:hypothetical protein